MRVAVIGGGVIGVCTAYYLAEAGHEVAVIERYGNVAQEASFGNLDLMGPTSVLRNWTLPGLPFRVLSMLLSQESPISFSSRFEPAMWSWMRRWVSECRINRFKQNHHKLKALADYSNQLMSYLVQTHDLDFQQRKGSMLMFRTAKELQLAGPTMELLVEAGTTHELLDPEAVRQIEPALSTETQFHSALYIPDDLAGNCPLFVRQMKMLAQNLGVEFHFNNMVTSIHNNESTVSLQIEDRTVEVDAVVIAAGSDSGRLLHGLGINVPLYPVKVYSASATVQEFEMAPQISIFDDTYHVALTRLGKRIRIAGCAELGSSTVNLHKKAVNTLVKVADDWFPSAANYRNANFWCGTTGMLPEGIPLLGATSHPNIFINTGHGAGSWALAVGSGKLVADIISQRETEISPEGLNLSRYTEMKN
jgi:D-amino-acid dehydrogenase